MLTTIKRPFLLVLILVSLSASVSGRTLVSIDVGGTVFKTTAYTMKKLDGTLKTWAESLDAESPPSIFVDRSPEHFDVILNFLRDGDVILPESQEDVKEILKEAEFYQLEELQTICRSKLEPRENSYDLNFIESDTELLQLITSPEKPLIIFYPPVTVAGKIRYPEGLEVKSFLDKYDDDFDIYFKPYKMGRGDREEWLWSIHKEDDRADFKYHRHNFPKQTFIALFEESIRGF